MCSTVCWSLCLHQNTNYACMFIYVCTEHVRGSLGMYVFVRVCVWECIRLGRSLTPGTTRDSITISRRNGQEHRPFLRLSNNCKIVFLVSGLKSLVWRETLPELAESSASTKVGQRLSACCVIEHEKGLLSKHFLGPDSSLMRVLIAVTHADEGSMGQAPYSDIC